MVKAGVKSTAYDLNGDGKKDNISLVCNNDNYSFKLTVNGKTASGEGDNFDGVFCICDINTSDKIKEIAVTEAGPSDDYMTSFFWYDGKTLIPMGKIQGASHSMLVDGSGVLATKSRGDILQTWFYSDNYKLDSKHLLVNVPKSSYLMNTVVTVKKSLALQKSTTDKSTSYTLKVGEKVVIVSTDNKKWCKVLNSKGQAGWFYVSDFYNVNGTKVSADNYFDGLCFAD